MAAPGLLTPAQLNFEQGMFKQTVARHLVPAEGAWDIVNGLLDEDGSIYKRGGGQYLSTSAFGSSLRSIWDGFLGPGQRTFIANTSDFGVLDAAEAPVNLGGAGLSAPRKAVELAGMLFVGGGAMYGGSRKTADYTTGTVTVTNGSKTVTGSGTTWNTLVDAGMLFRIGSGRYYPVASIDSTTQITLRDAYEGSTASGQAYTLAVLGSAGAPYRTSDIYFVAADRLFSCEGSRAYFTPPGSPHSYNPDEEFHEIPGGASIVGGGRVRDTAIVFATNGVWQLSGLHLDLTDDFGNPQQRREQVSEDLILWSHEGIATYRGALVAPCADGVWLVDGTSTPQLLSRNIAGLYRSYVAAGYKTGLATVYRSHYLLPILSASNVVVDQLVCRLDKPAFPWTRLAGFSASVPAWAVRSGGSSSPRSPWLLGASSASSARVVKCNGFFEPTASVKADPDGSIPEPTIDTRDYPTTDGFAVNMVRRVKVRYELVDAGSDDPTLSAYYSVGDVDTSGVAVWDTAIWDTATWADEEAGEWVQLSGTAPEDDGRNPYPWHVNRQARFIRFRLRSSSPAARMALRSIQLFVREKGKQ